MYPRNTGRAAEPALNCTATNGLDWMRRSASSAGMSAPFACSRLPFGWARRSSSIEVKSGRISWPFVERIVRTCVDFFFWVPVTSATKKPSRSAVRNSASRS